MGFPTSWRRNILEAALGGYIKIHDSMTRNRLGASSKMKRRRKKLVGKQDWFRKNDEPEEDIVRTHERQDSRRKPRKRNSHTEEGSSIVEAVMFIPHTPGSLLKKN